MCYDTEILLRALTPLRTELHERAGHATDFLHSLITIAEFSRFLVLRTNPPQ